MKIKKRVIVLILILTMAFSVVPLNNTVEAATGNIVKIDDSVYLKQPWNSDTCTLYAVLMLFRRGGILLGSNWKAFTEANYRNSWWDETLGMRWTQNAGGMSSKFEGDTPDSRISHCTAELKKQIWIGYLASQPQGVVLYYFRSGKAHAILLTRYDSSTDTFYCADPAPNAPSGEIPLNQSILGQKDYVGYHTGHGNNTQEEILAYIDYYCTLWVNGAATGTTGFEKYAGTIIKSNDSKYVNEGTSTAIESPSAPQNFKAVRVNDTTGSISWSASTGATGYDVQYRRNGSDWLNETDYSSGTSYNAVGLMAIVYEYRVRAKNSGGYSDWVYMTYDNSKKTTVPTTPKNLKAVKIDSTTATISWSSVDGATGYDVQYRRNGIDWSLETDYSSGTSYKGIGLMAIVYEYRVRAKNSGGYSDWVYVTYDNSSEEKSECSVNHTVFSPTPGSNFETKQINGKWTAVCKNCGEEYPIREKIDGADWQAGGIGEYKVIVSAAKVYNQPYGKGDYTTLKKGDKITAIAYTVNAYGHTYFKLASGKWICYSLLNEDRTYTYYLNKIDTDIPEVPKNLKAVKVNNTTATISWDAAERATEYEVQYRRNGSDWMNETDYSSGTSYNAEDLSATIYEYRVRAKNKAGYSGWSAVIKYDNNGSIYTSNDRIDQLDVFDGLKQPYGDIKCPLYACLTMFRRAALLNGDSDWKEFTVANYESLWANPIMIYEPKAHNMSGYAFADDTFWRNGKFYPNMSGKSAEVKKVEIINLLIDHPEGIVIYSWGEGKVKAREHALLLTHYDPIGDVFYCTDSGISRQGIIPLTESSLADINHIGAQYGRSCKNALEILEYVNQYWAIIDGVDSRVLASPKNLKAGHKNGSVINISWNAVEGAVGYDIRYRYDEDQWAVLTSNHTGTSHQATGLPSTVSEFQVRALCRKGYSPWNAVSICPIIHSEHSPAPGSNYETKKVNGKWAAICKNCGEEYILPKLDTSDYGIYKVTKKTSLCSAPYQEGKTSTIKKKKKVVIVGSVINAYGNKWLYTKDGEWIYSGYVKKLSKNTKKCKHKSYITVILPDGTSIKVCSKCGKKQ